MKVEGILNRDYNILRSRIEMVMVDNTMIGIATDKNATIIDKKDMIDSTMRMKLRSEEKTIKGILDIVLKINEIIITRTKYLPQLQV